MSRILSVVLTFVLLLFFRLTPSVNATPVSITSGNLGGGTFDDLAFIIIGNGITLHGYESFPVTLGEELATGHLSERIPTFNLNGVVVLQPIFMNFELSFTPTPLLAMSPFAPGVAGSSVTEPFTMTGVLSGANFTPIDFVGQGTFTAGWFPREGPDFGRQFFSAQFVPEPPSIALLIFGAIGLLVGFKHFPRASRATFETNKKSF
jgi:hypothetical protein